MRARQLLISPLTFAITSMPRLIVFSRHIRCCFTMAAMLLLLILCLFRYSSAIFQVFLSPALSLFLRFRLSLFLRLYDSSPDGLLPPSPFFSAMLPAFMPG